MVARFRETIPTVKSVSSSEIYKNSDFDRNYHFTLFQKIRIFSGFTEALKIASYILNQVPSKFVPKTPYELWLQKKPTLLHFHI